jgi:hypothetical protein
MIKALVCIFFSLDQKRLGTSFTLRDLAFVTRLFSTRAFRDVDNIAPFLHVVHGKNKWLQVFASQMKSVEHFP